MFDVLYSIDHHANITINTLNSNHSVNQNNTQAIINHIATNVHTIKAERKKEKSFLVVNATAVIHQNNANVTTVACNNNDISCVYDIAMNIIGTNNNASAMTYNHNAIY